MKIPNRTGIECRWNLSLARIVSEDSQLVSPRKEAANKSSKDS